jgi:TetR/AcrR family transcriptional regulator, fatty acid metabolism regulator protein
LISKGGIQALTTKNLAVRLGLSEPALYRHFKNKQDILLALLNFFKTRQKAMYARVLDAEPSPSLALERMIGEVFSNFSDKPAMVTVIFAEGMFQNDSQLSKVLFSILDDRQGQFASLIAEGQGPKGKSAGTWTTGNSP